MQETLAASTRWIMNGDLCPPSLGRADTALIPDFSGQIA
jgi:hypothetical protein